jgi:hypothetical protein
MTANNMSLENMSTVLPGVYGADLTVFATAPTCKPELDYFFGTFLSQVLLTFDIHQRTKLYFGRVVVLPMHVR